MADEQNKGYDVSKAGPIVAERFDEATCRDEFEGDHICILHGLEKAMVGTTEVMRTLDKPRTLEDLQKWLTDHNFMTDCKMQLIAEKGTDELTIDWIEKWAARDDYRSYLFDREFTEDVLCTVAVYERSLCIKCLADDYNDEDTRELHKDEYSVEELQDPDLLRELKYKDAEEFYEYNTVRALPYAHAAAPLIVEGFDVDSDRWESFKNAVKG